MSKIRKVTKDDWQDWVCYDRHIAEDEFLNKVRMGRGYVISEAEKIIGVFRWNLFWDTVPCMTLIYLDEVYRRKGLGKELVTYWEGEMRKEGYKAVMTSTQVDEQSQHFYRKMGYKDCGCLVLDIPSLAQPMEMFLIKEL